MMVDTEQTYQFDEISLSPVSQNVTSTKLNPFSPAVSERSVQSLKKWLVTSLVLQGKMLTKGSGFAGHLAKLPTILTLCWALLITPTHAIKHKKNVFQELLDLFTMFSLQNFFF